MCLLLMQVWMFKTNVWSNVLKIEDDTSQAIDFENGAIESGFGDYEGTDRAVKRQFELKHRQILYLKNHLLVEIVL